MGLFRRPVVVAHPNPVHPQNPTNQGSDRHGAKLLLVAAAVWLAIVANSTPAHAAEPPISPSAPLTLTLSSLRPAPATNGPIRPALPNPKRRPGQAPVIAGGPVYGPSYYYVQPPDTLDGIAANLGIATPALMAANGMTWPGSLVPGYLLRVPGPDGSLPPWATAAPQADGTLAVSPRKDAGARLTPAARAAGPDSPYYNKTWVTYYGRPGIPLMGIIGEHSAADIMPLIKAKAAEYDEANGPQLGVQPAVHLVWGMATVDPQPDNSHLGYLTDAEVMPYIEEGLKAGVAVILDSQIANLSPTASISAALPYLKYPNVHLAIDPEFAVVHKGQYVPGNPIGYITADQVNDVEREIADYMRCARDYGQAHPDGAPVPVQYDPRQGAAGSHLPRSRADPLGGWLWQPLRQDVQVQRVSGRQHAIYILQAVLRLGRTVNDPPPGAGRRRHRAHRLHRNHAQHDPIPVTTRGDHFQEEECCQEEGVASWQRLPVT